MEREVRYCTTEDGVRIAYCIEGDGPPLLLVHYVYSFSLTHLVPTYQQAIEQLASGYSIIRFDMRGTGLSQREVDDLSAHATRRDIEAVVDALELDSFSLLGAAFGGLRAIDYASSHPGRVTALVLYQAFPRLADAFPREMLPVVLSILQTKWDMGPRILANIATRSPDHDDHIGWTDIISQSITGDTMARLVQAQIDLDVTNQLERIQCPSLICHARKDIRLPFALGEELADGIPLSRIVPLDGDSGGAFTDPDQAVEAIQDFLREQYPETSALADDVEAPARPLTARETEILQLIAAGLTSREISEKLCLSIRTVGRHITNIYEKIGARTRADATSYAVRRDLLKE